MNNQHPAFVMLDEIIEFPESMEQWEIPAVVHASKRAAHLCGHSASVWAAESGSAYWRKQACDVAKKVASRVGGIPFDTHGNVGVVAPSHVAARAAYAVLLAAESIFSGPYDQWPEEELEMLGVTDWPRHPRDMFKLCPERLPSLIDSHTHNKVGICESIDEGRVEITIYPTKGGDPVQKDGDLCLVGATTRPETYWEEYIVRYPVGWGLPCVMARRPEDVEFAPSKEEEESVPPFGIDF